MRKPRLPGSKKTGMATSTSPGELAQIAYYYPNATWQFGSSDFVKNLTLFFDGVGLLLPEYLRDKPFAEDPSLATGLSNEGLLHIFTPERVIDQPLAERLATSLTEVLVTGVLDPLGNERIEFHELSMSRLGYMGDPELTQMLFEELASRGLARKSIDGKSIPMHPVARCLILVILAQLMRANSAKLGIEICPTTDRPEVLSSLRRVLDVPAFPTSGQVVAFDLQIVSVDVGSVPIEDVLAFRRENLDEYQRYARDVRRFAREVASLPIGDRQAAFEDRAAEIADRGSDLRRKSEKAWKRPASLLLALAGAALGVADHGVLSALFGAGGAFAAYGDSGSADAGPYTYLMRAKYLR